VLDAEANDRRDLSLAAEGDHGAFEGLVARHLPAMERMVALIVKQEATAEDALQEALLAMSRHAGSFDGRGSVRAWMMTIARNAAKRALRRRSGQPSHFDEWTDDQPLAELGLAAGWGSSPPSPERMAERGQLREQLSRAMGRLTESDQEILYLRDVEGWTGPECARALGIKEATAKTRLHRARLRLMAELRRGGFDDGT